MGDGAAMEGAAGRVRLELGPVQQTLLLPLWGRAVESARRRPRLVDRAAERIVAAIDFDFQALARSMSEISRLAWIARSLVFDGLIRGFLAEHPAATVVNIGCGFDTTFERVDNGRVTWIDLDLPDVVALRRRFIPETPRRRLVAASVFDPCWSEPLDGSAPVFLLAAGVFYYFTEKEMRSLLVRLAGELSSCEMAFDIASTMGVGVANRRVIRAGGMSDQATLKWGIDDPAAMERWDPRIHLLSARPMFADFPSGPGLRGRIGMRVSDRYRIMSNVHLRLEA